MLESWSRLGDAPFARVNHQAIFLNGYLYVFGGFNSQLRNINYNSHQLDVFRWNVREFCRFLRKFSGHNKWEELKYPLRLKAWSCSTQTWTSDPLSSVSISDCEFRHDLHVLNFRISYDLWLIYSYSVARSYFNFMNSIWMSRHNFLDTARLVSRLLPGRMYPYPVGSRQNVYNCTLRIP